MDCSKCIKRDICTSLCSELSEEFIQEEKKIRVAFWSEFGYSKETIEFLVNNRYSKIQNTLLDSSEKLTHKENIDFIKYLIEEYLPEKQKEILLDHFFNGVTQLQLAKKFNIRQPTVFFHIQEGIKTLKKLTSGLL